MSKVFEAILKLERETGKVLPGLLSDAARLFQNGAAKDILVSRSADTVGSHSIRSDEVWEDQVPYSRSLLSEVPVEVIEVKPETRILYHLEPHGAGADRFRLLRMRLCSLWDAGKLKTLLVTSAHAGDGKSTVVLNLATALSEAGERKILVVEGDLVKASLSNRLGIAETSGLAECIETGLDPFACIRRIEPLSWYLLSAGHHSGNSTEVLQRPVTATIFSELQQHFDWILIDSPPVVPLTDTLVLRQHADAGLLVIRSGQTPGDAVDAAVERFGLQNLLGIVLNGSAEMERLYSEYRRYYSGAAKTAR